MPIVREPCRIVFVGKKPTLVGCDARDNQASVSALRMMTVPLAGTLRKRKSTKSNNALKWCVFSKRTVRGQTTRQLSCHKLKRTALAVAKKRKGTVKKRK